MICTKCNKEMTETMLFSSVVYDCLTKGCGVPMNMGMGNTLIDGVPGFTFGSKSTLRKGLPPDWHNIPIDPHTGLPLFSFLTKVEAIMRASCTPERVTIHFKDGHIDKPKNGDPFNKYPDKGDRDCLGYLVDYVSKP